MLHTGLLTAWNYAWSVLTACMVLGIAIYLLDRKFGAMIYRFVYDFFHKEPMPREVVRGFLYNQSTNRGITVAFVVSSVYSAYMFWQLGLGMDVLAELIIYVLMNPMLVIGFKAGYWVHKFLLRRNTYFDNLDEIGRKIETIDVGEVTEQVKKKGAPFFSFFKTMLPSGRTVAPPPKATAVPETLPQEPPLKFGDALKRYRGRQ